MSEADIQDLNPPIFSQWCSTSSTTRNNLSSTWRASSLWPLFYVESFLFWESSLSRGPGRVSFLSEVEVGPEGEIPLIPSRHNLRHNSDYGWLWAFGSPDASKVNSNSPPARPHCLMTLLLSRTTFHFKVSGCCVQRQWSKRHSNKCSAYKTSGLKQKGAKTCLITIEAKAWCDCHWGKWYCSSCSHNFSFTRKRSNGWYCTKAQCCTNLYGVSNKRRIKRWNLRLVILCVKILTSSDAIAIPNMCLFSPQTQLFVKFFSMQKRRSREKVDFATKQREWQQ